MPSVRRSSFELCVAETIDGHDDTPCRILVVGRLRGGNELPVRRPADEARAVGQVFRVTFQKYSEAAPLAAERSELRRLNVCAARPERLLVCRKEEVVTEERRILQCGE